MGDIFKILTRIFFILLLLLLLGCQNEDYSQTISMKEVMPASKYDPYVGKIIVENIQLREKAASIVSECSYGDKECQLNKIYRYVVGNYKYYGDPRSNEFVQTPFETLNVLGGDCEDLAILTISLLENIGINTYLGLSKDHAFALGCGMNITKLQGEVVSSMNREETVVDEKISIGAYSGVYYGGDGEKVDYPFEIRYKLNSDKPLKIFVVPNNLSLVMWAEGEDFIYYEGCTRQAAYRVSDSCKIDRNGGTLIINYKAYDAAVDLEISRFGLIIDMTNFSTNYYQIKNESCVILDPATGKYSYPGYGIESEGNKVAIDPVTLEEINIR